MAVLVVMLVPASVSVFVLISVSILVSMSVLVPVSQSKLNISAFATFSLPALPSRSGLHTVMAAWLSTLWQAVQCEGLVLVYMCGGYEYVIMTEYVRAYACVAICVKCK